MPLAILVGLFGCLFCAGKGFEEQAEKAKASYKDATSDESSPVDDRGDRRNMKSIEYNDRDGSRYGGDSDRDRDRDRRRRSHHDGSHHGHHGSHRESRRNSVAGYAPDPTYPYYGNEVAYIPAEDPNSSTLIPSATNRRGERFGSTSSASDEGVKRWVGNVDGPSVEESGDGSVAGGRRRRRTRRDEVD